MTYTEIKRHYRAARFLVANGMTYSPERMYVMLLLAERRIEELERRLLLADVREQEKEKAILSPTLQ